MSAPIPANETGRLQALVAYGILDTASEVAFDDLALLASTLCQTPIAAISLIDRDRQWFKACHGIDISETHRDIAFCAHAILEPDTLMVVRDARVDPRFSDNPLVTGEPKIRFYSSMPVLSSDGFAVGSVCVADPEVRDLSQAQRNAMIALGRQVSIQLELRRSLVLMQEQSARMADAHHAAESAFRAKSTFLSGLSHAIRTPMNGVLGIAELLRNTELTPKQEGYVCTIIDSGRQLMRIVGDSVAFAADDARHEVEPEPIRLAGIFEEAVTICRPAAMARQVRLTVDVAPNLSQPLVVDHLRLRQLLSTVVSFAIDGAGASGVVLRAAREGRFLSIEVRASSLSNGGLPPPVANIVDILNGTLELQARPGVLRIRIPTSGRSPHVLIADENDVTGLVLASMLENQGCDVCCVSSGQAAVDAVASGEYDLAFLESRLPDMDAQATAKAIRAEGHMIPLLFVTSGGEDNQTIETAGAVGLLEKPVSERSVAEALARWLQI